MNVMSPSPLTKLLEDNMSIPHGAEVVDVGCGSGTLALRAAELGAGRVHAIDTNPDAVASTNMRAAQAGLGDVVQARVGRAQDLHNLFQAKVDVILANPPQLPYKAKVRRADEKWRIEAYDGGGEGRAVLDAIIRAAPLVLRRVRESSLQIVTSSVVSLHKTHDIIRSAGLEFEVIAKHEADFRPTYLESMDLIDRTNFKMLMGMPREEIQVIRAWLT